MYRLKLYFILRITGLFILFCFCFFATGLSQDKIENGYLKEYYSVDDGLSQSEVTSVIQDKYGFIWLGTRGGLNRFDGYNFMHFKPEAGTSEGLFSPSIETLFLDNDGSIWIGTKSGGIAIYDNQKNEFVRNDVLSQVLPNRIISLYEDRSGNYWIGTWDDGVYMYDPQEGNIEHYIENERVGSILQTRDGTMWFGSGFGLHYKKPGEDEVSVIVLKQGFFEVTELLEIPEDNSLWVVGWGVGLCKLNYLDFTHERYDFNGRNTQELNCYSLLEDRGGRLWVGTWGNGLYCREKGAEAFEKVLPLADPLGRVDKDMEVILDLMEDTKGGIWVGTDGGGVVWLSSDRSFNTITGYSDEKTGPWHVNAVEASSDGRLWVGTRFNGLHFSEDNQTFSFVGFSRDSPRYGARGFMVNFLYEGEEGMIWVGLENGLFVVAEKQNGEYELINAADLWNSESLRGLRKVQEVKVKGPDLWVGTQQSGLYWFQKQGGNYKAVKRFYSGNNAIRDNRISALSFDLEGDLWVGTYKGLYRFRQQDSLLVDVHQLLIERQELFCDIILSCDVDSSNRLWIGTPCSLNSITPDGQGNYILNEYGEKQGLTDNYVNAVKPYGKYIWVSTNAGISRFDPALEVFRNFDVSDGVGGYNFAEGSCDVDLRGIIYFGGYTDLTYLDPLRIRETKVKPAIAITDFRVMNQPIPVSDDGLLPVSINETKKITLNYKQREFSLEITALDYKSPKNNQYAYRLLEENGHGDWVNIGQRRHISFNNLQPGDYILQLAGSNSNGIWNRDGRSLEIKVLPPPWKTWYAFVIYLLVMLGIVIMIIQVSLRQERLKNMARIEHMNRIKEQELNEYKLRFFTDISHELKTPLTLIQGPVEELRKKAFTSMSAAFFEKRMQMIHGSVNRLLVLLHQLLEFRKVDAGQVMLSASKSDLAAFVVSVCRTWDDNAKNKGIEFTRDLKLQNRYLWFDPDKFEVILNNLLSNAFKYHGDPGKVHLSLSEGENEVILSVMNNGEKIAAEDIEKLFDRFYQVSGDKRQKGYGIGLFLVKKYVELHKGNIDVESMHGGLISFTVRLPKGEQHLLPEEKVNASGFQLQEHERIVVDETETGKEKRLGVSKSIQGTRILVVEDDKEVRNYISSLLEEHFDVITSEDGLSGYNTAIEFLPDLVISDVMMPKSDGYELCSRLKKNEKTAHIPVILLTAKDKPDDHLIGTRKGADAYLTKPFDPLLLQEKVNQLITSRLFLAGKYQRKIILDPLNKEITSEDEKMIKRVIRIIEKHADDPDLDADFVAGEVGMSNSTFYRKMKKTVDQTPGDFIKTTRLKLAARYLKETNLTVSEIVEKVGYSDIPNFRKNFKNEFRLSPADYRKNTADPDSK